MIPDGLDVYNSLATYGRSGCRHGQPSQRLLPASLHSPSLAGSQWMLCLQADPRKNSNVRISVKKSWLCNMWCDTLHIWHQSRENERCPQRKHRWGSVWRLRDLKQCLCSPFQPRSWFTGVGMFCVQNHHMLNITFPLGLHTYYSS